MDAEMNASGSEALLLERRDGAVAWLTLNRGEHFNPLSSAMIAALDAEFEAAASDASTRVVVLAAAGKGFSAGHDLKEMRAHAHDNAGSAGCSTRAVA